MTGDAVSEAGFSSFSATDRMVFQMLSNERRVDMEQMIEHTPRIEEFVQARLVDNSPPLVRNASDTEPMPISAHVPAPVSTPPRATTPPQLDPRPPPPSPKTRFPTPPEPPEQCQIPPTATAVPRSEPKEESPLHSLPHAPRSGNSPFDVAPVCDHDTENFTKQSLLLDLRDLERHHGVQASRMWTMDDRVEDIMLDVRRLTLSVDERSNVNMMREGMRIFVTGIEMLNSRIGLLDLDGWSSDVCKDLDKHDANLSRIYRKWWKRSTSTSPEVDICLSLLGSIGMHHMKRTMSKQLMSRASSGSSMSSSKRAPKARRVSPTTSDDEGLPPTDK